MVVIIRHYRGWFSAQLYVTHCFQSFWRIKAIMKIASKRPIWTMPPKSLKIGRPPFLAHINENTQPVPIPKYTQLRITTAVPSPRAKLLKVRAERRPNNNWVSFLWALLNIFAAICQKRDKNMQVSLCEVRKYLYQYKHVEFILTREHFSVDVPSPSLPSLVGREK